MRVIFKTEKVIAVTQSENPYISVNGDTMIYAHRSGGSIAPENTMMAFENCVKSSEFVVDIFEIDLHITKDGELILLHDATLDRTSNSVEVFGEEGVIPWQKTYEELRELNMGAHFTTDSGDSPYFDLLGAVNNHNKIYGSSIS